MAKTIVIADDNAAIVSGLQDFVANSEKYKIVGTASTGTQAIELVNSLNPDYLLLDIVMPELDGFGVLSALENKRTIVVMMSQLRPDGFVQKAMQYGASYYLAKPFDYGMMLKVLDRFDAHLPERQPSAKINKTLDERLSNLLIWVRIHAHTKGYQFLREAIKMTIEQPDIINSITKRLYPGIAEVYQTSPSKVERAIRHAIEVAWNRGKIENINNVFGIKIYSPNEKPTNGEFIALIADKLLLESA